MIRKAEKREALAPLQACEGRAREQGCREAGKIIHFAKEPVTPIFFPI